jgi:hypothetical protein
MSRLRNRMVKAEFWTDPDLLAWPRDKRFFYMGIRSLAEDSGCIEDSPFAWTCVLYSSPYDHDITIEIVTKWRDELVADGKLVPYEIDGKPYLFQTTFHKYETPRNPQPPTIPLPPWIIYKKTEGVSSDGKPWSRSLYSLSTESSETQYGLSTVSDGITDGLSTGSPVQSSPVLKSKHSAAKIAAPRDVDWEDRATKALERTAFPAEYQDLAGAMAAENKTGKVAVSRVVKALYEPLLRVEGEVAPAAMAYGLNAALAATAPNVNYVKRAAGSYGKQPIERKPNGNGKKPMCAECLVDLTYDEEGQVHCPICGKVPA